MKGQLPSKTKRKLFWKRSNRMIDIFCRINPEEVEHGLLRIYVTEAEIIELMKAYAENLSEEELLEKVQPQRKTRRAKKREPYQPKDRSEELAINGDDDWKKEFSREERGFGDFDDLNQPGGPF